MNPVSWQPGPRHGDGFGEAMRDDLPAYLRFASADRRERQ
jgi:hypothetical protein